MNSAKWNEKINLCVIYRFLVVYPGNMNVYLELEGNKEEKANFNLTYKVSCLRVLEMFLVKFRYLIGTGLNTSIDLRSEN